MPSKPPKPAFHDAPKTVAKHRDESSDGYQQALEADALAAGLPAPALADMERAFTWTADTTRRVLRPGDAPVDVAGLRLTAVVTRMEGSEELLGLVVENPSATPLAYAVDTAISSGNAACQNRTLIPHNGNVVDPHGKEIRSECAWKRGMELYVDRVETAPVSPMNAYYLSQVPPQALGTDDREAQGHRPHLPAGVVPCNVSIPQSVRRAIEDGVTSWRDLADFYARHPCGTYQFPDGYKAFTQDGERALPVVGG